VSSSPSAYGSATALLLLLLLPGAHTHILPPRLLRKAVIITLFIHSSEGALHAQMARHKGLKERICICIWNVMVSHFQR
jgi:hypothetical protein